MATTIKAPSGDARRLRMYTVSHDMLSMLLAARPLGMSGDKVAITIPHISGVPRDAEVANVTYSVDSNGWAIVMRHSSFDVVPECHSIPRDIGDIQLWTVLVKTDELFESMLKAEIARPQTAAAKSADRPAWEFLGPPPK